MGCIEIKYHKVNFKDNKALKIMVFTEGTVIGPERLFHHFCHSKYIPIKHSADLLRAWEDQDAEIVYVTSRKKEKHVLEIKDLLCRFGFPGVSLYFRSKGQKYKDIVEMYVPDILIEDDCRSIGGAWQMCITYVEPALKAKIKSIVVKEFAGIDDLPRQLPELLKFME